MKKSAVLICLTVVFGVSWAQTGLIKDAIIKPVQNSIDKTIELQKGTLGKLLNIDSNANFVDIFTNITKFNLTQIKECYDMKIGDEEFNMFEHTVFDAIQIYYKHFADNFELAKFPERTKNLFKSMTDIGTYVVKCITNSYQYKLGFTPFTDWSDKEFQVLMGNRYRENEIGSVYSQFSNRDIDEAYLNEEDNTNNNNNNNENDNDNNNNNGIINGNNFFPLNNNNNRDSTLRPSNNNRDSNIPLSSNNRDSTFPPNNNNRDSNIPLVSNNRDSTLRPSNNNRDSNIPLSSNNRDSTFPPNNNNRDSTFPPSNNNRDSNIPLSSNNRDSTFPPNNNNRDSNIPLVSNNRDSTLRPSNNNRDSNIPLSSNNRDSTFPPNNNNRDSNIPLVSNNRDSTLRPSNNNRDSNIPLSSNNRDSTFPPNNNNRDSTLRPSNNNRDSNIPLSSNNRDSTFPSNNNRDLNIPLSSNNRDSTLRPSNNNRDSTLRPSNNNRDSTLRPSNNNRDSTLPPRRDNTLFSSPRSSDSSDEPDSPVVIRNRNQDSNIPNRSTNQDSTVAPSGRDSFFNETQPLVRPRTKREVELDRKCLVRNKRSLPRTFDWRALGKVTPVRYQGKCGSCWAFASLSALESAYLIKGKSRDRNLDLSEQQLLNCARQDGCKGGTSVDAFNYILENRGVTGEKSEPYKFEDKRCKKSKKKTARIRDYCLRGVYVKVNGKPEQLNDEDIKYIVREFGPVYATMYADNVDMKNLKSGIYSNANCPKETNHAVTIVGWEPNAWLVKNSWGRGWGDSGFFRLRMGQNMCGINTYVTYPIV